LARANIWHLHVAINGLEDVFIDCAKIFLLIAKVGKTVFPLLQLRHGTYTCK
jgi:hypothetical protein